VFAFLALTAIAEFSSDGSILQKVAEKSAENTVQ
jgi:hypothetical protein